MSLYSMLQGGESGGKNTIPGVAVGLVTNNKDPEHMGRVKITFPWRSGNDESYWARVVSFMAGKERGGYFLPEVGDEVLVAFDSGDLNHPYVIGSLWNGEDQPPATNENGNNDVRMIKSRSGHELIFNDEQGKESIELRTSAGHQIVLDDQSGGRMEIKVGSFSVVLDSGKNEMVLESPAKLRLKSQAIEIEADSVMKLKAGATLTINGSVVQIN